MTLEFSKSGSGSFLLKASQLIKRPLPEVFDFFSKAENLEILTPQFLNFKIVTPTPVTMNAGTIIDYKIYLRGIPLRWKSLITSWHPPHSFIDKQIKGPYSKWEHLHSFSETTEGTLVEDLVDYRVFGGFLVEKLFVRPDLSKIFAYRQAKLEELFPAT